MDVVEEIIRPYTSLNGSTQSAGWRDSSSWLFNRPAFNRKGSGEST